MDTYQLYLVGVLLCGLLGLITLTALASRRRRFLQPDTFKSARLIEKETITYNTSRYRFSLGDGVRLGLPIGQHISFQFVDPAGKVVMRSYTPVTGNETVGYVDFVIKVYPAGKMSQHVDHLNINDSILMRGPKGRFQYRRGMKRALGMIAGGTGVTPMYQIMRQIASDAKDDTQVHLLFANVSIHDILIKEQLDELVKHHPDQLHVRYVLDSAPEGWQGEQGYVTADMIRRHCPQPAEDAMLLVCGPRPMTKALEGIAAELGYGSDQLHTF